MDVKEAVRIALEYVQELFVEEQISHLGLEEVEYNVTMDDWQVTVGFSRPWDYPNGSLAMLAGGSTPHRSYKRVTIKDGAVVSVTNRDL